MLIYGRNPVLEALRAGEVETLWVANGIEKSFVRELEAFGLPLRWVPRIELDQEIGTTQHQGVVAEVAELSWSEPADIWERAQASGQEPLFVLLDGITDPRNFGAIVRSAEVLGAHGVVVEERRSAPLSPVVAKTAAGATSHIPMVQVKNLPRFMDSLKAEGVWIYGAAGEAKAHASQLDYKRPIALVIGAEGEGLRRLVREKCDDLVSIPVMGKIQSLNASVAASILLYETQRNRGLA